MPYFAEIIHMHPDAPDGFPVERLDQPYPSVDDAVAGAVDHLAAINAEPGTATFRIIDEDGLPIELTDEQAGRGPAAPRAPG
jgi:hypothetical protein